jgi:hypothetical protein
VEDHQGTVIEKGERTRLRALPPSRNGGTSRRQAKHWHTQSISSRDRHFGVQARSDKEPESPPCHAITVSPHQCSKLPDLTTPRKTNKISYL